MFAHSFQNASFTMLYHGFSHFIQSAEKVRDAVVPHTSNVRTVRGAGPHIKNQCAAIMFKPGSIKRFFLVIDSLGVDSWHSGRNHESAIKNRVFVNHTHC